MKRSAIALIVCLIATTACGLLSNDDIAEMSVKLTSDSGEVEILRGDETISVVDTEELKIGDLVSTSDSARALVRLAGEKPNARYVNLAPGTEVRIESTKAIDGPLHTGGLVADVGAPIKVAFAGFDATSSNGAFRVDIGVASVRAGSYSGTVRLETPGQPRVSVSRLFEVQAAAGDLDGKEPYRLDTGDPWDRVFLRAVVDLDEDLTPLANGLRSQLGSSRPDLPYFRALADRDVGFMKRYLSRPTVDLLTGFLVAQNSPGSLEKNFKRSFRLFDDGAKWAVVAGILDASFKTLVSQLSDVAAATGAVAGGEGSDAVFSVAAAQALSEGESGEDIVAAGPPDGGGGDPGDDPPPDDNGGGGGKPSPPAEECDAACQVQKQIDELGSSPSPSFLDIDP